MSEEAAPKNDVYSGNYPRAKKQAIARSSGKCQFCGIRQAREGHHWAWPDYPSGQEVQGHHITALCLPCHELATTLRDWVGRKNANFDELAGQIEDSNNFFQKRKVFSQWFFPEDEEKEKNRVRIYNLDTYVPPKKITNYPSSHGHSSNKTTGKPNYRNWLFWGAVGVVVLLDLLNS